VGVKLTWRVAALLVTAVTAPGHHSTAPYDLIHGTIVGGVVTKFDWQNPHVRIALDVTGENYVVEHWSVELENPHILGRAGWTKDTLKAGDRISVTGGRAKDNSFRLRAVSVQLPDGRKLPALALTE
jgi:hypothetical protein